ncbi:Oxalate:formate antiporter [Schistosoma japonicum]|uniref:Oxalate:formate antiporter n=1 Tax=Schistosoma japonicum TaxID=6182 RepID=A0A4Z2DMZ3_SCHJA|nr:Oxalate:formate antiporter [Schistosoma japonicum]
MTVIGAVLIQITFGYFYTIANMVPYILSYIKNRVDPNIQSQTTVWLSALALASQGLSMALGGYVYQKVGFRVVVAIGCILHSGSVFLTYFTIQKTYIGVVVTYSVLMGLGLGFGYSVVMGVASRWFPKRRFLIVGLVVGGFGLGALIFTPIQTGLINPNNVQVNATTGLFDDPLVLDKIPNAILYIGCMLAGGQVIGFCLMSEKKQKNKKDTSMDNTDQVNIPPKEMFHYIDFYFLWVIMFLVIIPITIITSAYKLFGQKCVRDDQYLSMVASVSAIFNAGGRVMWGAIVDRVSFKLPLCIVLILWSIILFTFPHIDGIPLPALKGVYAIWVWMMFLVLSGVFVIMPGGTGNIFGPKYFSINYGIIFTGFTVGSILCSVITMYIHVENIYLMQFSGCGCVCLLAFVFALWIDDKKISPKVNCVRCATMCPKLRVHRNSSGQENKV